MLRLIPVLTALVVLNVLSGCVEHETWNQKLTLVIETPEGEITGSVVQKIDWEGVSGFYADATHGSDGAKTKMSVTGEALAIEVAPGKWLFALLKGDQGWKGEPGTNFGYAVGVPNGHFARSIEAVADVLALPKETPVILPREAWPMLVTFEDIAKPETVKRVDPDDLAATFGPGVALRAVTLAITEETATAGQMENLLGWLCNYLHPYRSLSGESGPIADNSLANNLGPGYFAIGVCK